MYLCLVIQLHTAFTLKHMLMEGKFTMSRHSLSQDTIANMIQSWLIRLLLTFMNHNTKITNLKILTRYCILISLLQRHFKLTLQRDLLIFITQAVLWFFIKFLKLYRVDLLYWVVSIIRIFSFLVKEFFMSLVL